MARDVVEVTPLVGSSLPPSFNNSVFYTAVKNTSLIALWYFFSTTLSLLNKHLIGRDGLDGKGKFPAPLLMTGVQFFCQFLLCRMFLDLGIIKRQEKPKEVKTWKQYCVSVVPNGVSTGLDIGFSNLSLKTISLSFYTMCKSTTPMFLLFFAFLWKLERPSWRLGGIMGVITGGILLLVYGETKFNFIGFSLVLTAACLAGLRWTLTQLFLQGDAQEAKIESGPLDLLEQLTPIMSGIVLLVSMCFENWHKLSESPYFEDFEQVMLTLLMIVVFGLVAFLMVWTEFKVIKETSALTFMVAGTCKEVVTVMAAVVFFHDDFGIINGIGLAILLFGVSLFNVHKYQKLKNGEIKAKRKSLKNGSGLHRESEAQMAEIMISDPVLED